MSTNESQRSAHMSDASFGFLDVIAIPTVGFCGGLLVVTKLGRPLEFHCTAPVAVNRSQQIIYGATYRGFLLAEQIGAALIDKSKHVPTTFLVRDADLITISQIVDPPVLMVETPSNDQAFDGTGLESFSIDGTTFWAANGARDDTFDLIESQVSNFHRKLPIDEPFERIATAIEEAYAGLRVA